MNTKPNLWLSVCCVEPGVTIDQVASRLIEALTKDFDHDISVEFHAFGPTSNTIGSSDGSAEPRQLELLPVKEDCSGCRGGLSVDPINRVDG